MGCEGCFPITTAEGGLEDSSTALMIPSLGVEKEHQDGIQIRLKLEILARVDYNN